uniref:Uncharacterized protein n=1 Tax=Anguilla anguilla TaxID=7936 RepID=A0A0E9TSH8_ANGAN
MFAIQASDIKKPLGVCRFNLLMLSKLARA